MSSRRLILIPEEILGLNKVKRNGKIRGKKQVWVEDEMVEEPSIMHQHHNAKVR